MKINALDLDSALQLGVSHAISHSFLLMPRFVCSLAEAGQHSEQILLRGGRRLQRALDIMHNHGLVHADVKSSNCLVAYSTEYASEWYLSDFGSSLKIGQEITSCTELFSPEPIMFQAASPRHDWMLLLVMLSVELDKGKLSELTKATEVGVKRIDKDLVLKRMKSAKLPELSLFLSELQEVVWPQPAPAGA